MRKYFLAIMPALVFFFVLIPSASAGGKQVATGICPGPGMDDYTYGPLAVGPYSQAIKKGGMVYLAGQIALDPCSFAEGAPLRNVMRDCSAYEPENKIICETERVMQNLGAVLAAAGLNFGDALSTTVYLKDINDFTRFNGVYGMYFKCGETSVDIKDSVGNIIYTFECAESDPYCGNNCKKKNEAFPPPSRATVEVPDIPAGGLVEVSMIAGK